MRSLNAKDRGRELMATAMIAVLAACSHDQRDPLAADYLDLPAGTPVVEHPATEPEARVVLPLERELEYADSSGTLQPAVGYTRLGAAGDGELVALFSEARSLARFSADADLVARWGEQGMGAGQLFGPIGLAVVGDEIVVADAAAMRLSRWRLNGEYLTEVSDDSLGLVDGVVGALDGGVLLKTVVRTQYDDYVSVTLFSLEGREQRRFTQMPADRNVIGPTVWPRPDAVVARGDRIYATSAAEYEVQAIDGDGSFAWVLRVPWPRLALGEDARRTIARTQRTGRALGANVADGGDGPRALPALAGIEVDGHGRLYVFPFVDDTGPTERYPVDVYDAAAGRRVASGWLPFQGWDAQSGDWIYRVEETADGATVIARYRLMLESAEPDQR